jgi:hypothetical protein
VTYRHYLQDAVFLAGIESEDTALLQQRSGLLEQPGLRVVGVDFEILCHGKACNGMAEDCRNILYDVFIDKTLALLDAEAEILKEMLRHGTVSAGFHAEAVRGSGRKTSVTLTWNGTDSDLIELVAALMAAGAIGTAEGRNLKIVDVIRVFEEVFHLKINALYTKRGKVFDRCTDTTPFIDSLRRSYNRMLDERLA